MASMDLIFRFLGVDAGAGHEFDKMAGKATTVGRALSDFALAGGAAATAVGVASIKMAGDFQAATEKIHTQANASNAVVDKLRSGILSMAGAVATSPTVLADAAYHIASVGQNSLSTAKQLDILKIAAEGAKIGGADLVDVTNALDAAVVSGIKGTKNFSQTMGVLNATVGAGDMQMQDLADAFGPLGAVLKGYNVNIKEAGAALAVFGDNNLRGAAAGTQLRMAVQALVRPVQGGQELLQSYGITAGNLASQMQHGGLTEALDVLMRKMRENGVTAKAQGDVLTQAFGKRAGVGLNVLEQELDRFHTKLREVGNGADGFASSWRGYSKTFQASWDGAKAAAQGLFIELGTKLLPAATDFMNWVRDSAVPGLDVLGRKVSVITGPFKELGQMLGLIGAGSQGADRTLSRQLGARAAHGIDFGAGGRGPDIVPKFDERTLGKKIGAFIDQFISLLIKKFASVDWVNVGLTVGKYAVGFLTGLTLGLITHFPDVIGDLATHWKTALVAAFSFIPVGRIADRLVPLVSKIPLLKIFAPLFSGMGKIGGLMERTVGKAFMTAVRGVGGAIERGLGLAEGTVTGALRRFVDHSVTWIYIHVDDMVKAGGRFIRGLGTGIGRGIEFVVASARRVVSRILSFFAPAGRWLPSKGFDVVAGLGRGILKGFSMITGFLKDLGGKITGFFGDAGTWLIKAGEKLIGGLISGIASKARSLWDSISGIASKIRSYFPFSPAKTGPLKQYPMEKAGKNIVTGLASGIGDNAKLAYLAASKVASELVMGMRDGWHGKAETIKHLLSDPVQNALQHLQDVVDRAESIAEQHRKTALQKLRQDLQQRRSDVQSLAGTISQGADLSGIFGTDANGNPTVGNVNAFLAGQVSPLRRFAHDLSAARHQSLNKYLLGELANLGPLQGDQALSQLLGNRGAIRQANQSEQAIRRFSTAAARTAENALYAGVIERDRAELRRQTEELRRIRQQLRRIDQKAGREVAQHVTVQVDKAGRFKLTREETREIARAIRQLRDTTGIDIKHERRRRTKN